MSETTAITVFGQRGTSQVPLETPHAPVRSLYIHVPFCFHKCHYCDFYSFVDTQDRQGIFVDRLEEELERLAVHAHAGVLSGSEVPAELDTLFVGGGTPSLLRPELWSKLLDRLESLFRTRTRGRSGAMEFTIECNPETVTTELMAIYAAGGVNRVSVGAQSFESRHLKTLERWHDPENVARALTLARDAGIHRRSIDLIFGVPGQSREDWSSDLSRALALAIDPGLDHLSCYALTYEPNTPMTARLQRGDFTATDDDTEAAMYVDTVSLLHAHGFDRYEVSNFSRSGSECRHNLAYWRHNQWLAAGPSASAFVAGHRWKNVPRLTDWMDGVARSEGYSPITDHETPDDRRLLVERIMTGLRLSEGIDPRTILADAERYARADQLLKRVRAHINSGMLVTSDTRWTLTDRGFLFADGIAADLMSVISA